MTREVSRVEQGDDMDRSLRVITKAARDFLDLAGPDSKHVVGVVTLCPTATIVPLTDRT